MKIDRSRKPEPSGELQFKMPSFESFKLNNGTNVYFIKKDVLPIFRINVIANAGSKFDPEDKKGLANLLAMCIDEGAGEFDALELSEQFDLLGAHFSVFANGDTLQITVQALIENFGKAVELLAKVLKEPKLNEEDFEREKRKVLTRLQQLQDEPDFLANTAFEKFLLGDKNPYSAPSIGITDNIQKINNENIVEFYKKQINPENIFIVIVGSISTGELKDKLNKQFEDWTTAYKPEAFSLSEQEDKKVIYVVDKKDSVQTEIRVGHHTTGRKEDDYFTKLLLNTVLGGQFSSRINLNLREKHGYTYGAGSGFYYLKDTAYFEVSTSVGIENTVNALKEIFYELENIRKGVTEKELAFAKSSIVKKFPLNFETYMQVASNFISKIIFDLPDSYFDTYIQNINAVTIEQVNEAAQKYILPGAATTVLVGDKEKIKEQLTTSDFGEIVFTELKL